MESLAMVGWSWLAAVLPVARNRPSTTNVKSVKAEVNSILFRTMHLLIVPQFHFFKRRIRYTEAMMASYHCFGVSYAALEEVKLWDDQEVHRAKQDRVHFGFHTFNVRCAGPVSRNRQHCGQPRPTNHSPRL